MSVIPHNVLAARLALDPEQSMCLRIVPPPFLPKGSDHDAVDLRLGSHFFIPRGHRTPYFCPGETPAGSLYQEEYVPVGHYLVLPAHNTVLGATLEYIKLPHDMSGQVLTKSSWARNFITIATAPWIHPRYRGCLTLEIANVSNTPIVLYPGIPMAQLVLFAFPDPNSSSLAQNPAMVTRDHIDRDYLGHTRPEPSGLKPADELLQRMGFPPSKVIHPYDEFEDKIIKNPRYRQRVIEEALDDKHNDWRELATKKLSARGYQIKDPPSQGQQ